MLTNCKNCGARLHTVSCDYCGTAYGNRPTVVYDPRYIKATDLDKDIIPVDMMVQKMFELANANFSNFITTVTPK